MRSLPDVQSQTEGFPRIAIEKVGVRHILADFNYSCGYTQPVLGEFSIYCSLSEETKGINMSRMAEAVGEWRESRAPHIDLSRLVRLIQEKSKAQDAYVKCSFNLPFTSETPSNHRTTNEVVNVTLESRLKQGNDGESVLSSFMTVKTVGMSLCPCSKEMSLLVNNINDEEKMQLRVLQIACPSLYEKVVHAGFGAHNQKSVLEIKVEQMDAGVSPFILVGIANRAFSCRTQSMLKRPDEKFITEASYLGGVYEDGVFTPIDNTGPKFVEDIARQVAEQLDMILDTEIQDYVVVVNNEESIHSGDVAATAVLTCGRVLK